MHGDSWRMRQLYVYIMASSSRTLYVGVTNDLRRRALQHRNGESAFTKRYRIRRLVYYELLGPPIVAIAREKQIKGLDRRKREALVTSMNPRWDDLANSWFKFPFGTPQDFSQKLMSALSARRRKVRGQRKRNS
jgi:putative endonuclease